MVTLREHLEKMGNKPNPEFIRRVAEGAKPKITMPDATTSQQLGEAAQRSMPSMDLVKGVEDRVRHGGRVGAAKGVAGTLATLAAAKGVHSLHKRRKAKKQKQAKGENAKEASFLRLIQPLDAIEKTAYKSPSSSGDGDTAATGEESSEDSRKRRLAELLKKREHSGTETGSASPNPPKGA